MKTHIILLLALVVAVSGCAQPKPYVPLTELELQGGGGEIYVFANDIRETLREVPVNDPETIMTLAQEYPFAVLIFDGSDTEDNAYFTVVVTNLQNKIPVYYAYKGEVFHLIPYYYIGDQWFDRNGNATAKPDLSVVPSIWLQGPRTGAVDTSINLVNRTIYVSGTDYRNLTMAGDRLNLLYFGIDELSDIEGTV